MLLSTAIIIWALSSAAVSVDLVPTIGATADNTGRKLIRQPETRILNLTYEKGGYIMYAHSFDEGLTWQEPESLAKGEFPCIALDYRYEPWISYLDNDTVFCAVYSNSRWVRMVVFGGNGIFRPGPPSMVISSSIPSNDIPIGYATFPAYSLQNNNSFIKYAKFDTTRVIVGDVHSGSGLVDSAACVSLTLGDLIHISWQQNNDIYYSQASVQPDYWGEISWSEPYNISNTIEPSIHPFIGSCNDSVYVTWLENNNKVMIASKPSSMLCSYLTYRIPVQSTRQKDYPVMKTSQILAWQEQNGNSWEIYANILGDTVNISGTTVNLSKHCYVDIGYPDGQGEPLIPPDYDFIWTEELAPYNEYEICFLKYKGNSNQQGGQQSIRMNSLQPVLYQNRPNPFNSKTTISFNLPVESKTSLKIYDDCGKLVRILIDAIEQSGTHRAEWDECSDQKLQPNGIYFFVLETPERKIVKKMILTR